MNDNFYKQRQLLPENFEEAARESGNDKGLVIRYQEVSILLISGFTVNRNSRHMTIVTISLHHLQLTTSIIMRNIW